MEEIFRQYPVYFIMAVAGTALYLAKLILFLISGDGDGDFDASETEVTDMGGATFSLISIQSILAFFMGTGWVGLACLDEFGYSHGKALLIASLFGFLMMLLSSFLTFKIKGLNHSPKLDYQKAVGVKGRAYTNIPEKGNGVGQAEVTFVGKMQVLQAVSEKGLIKSFTPIEVVEVDGSGNLVVKKV